MDEFGKRLIFILNGVWVVLLLCSASGLFYGVYPPFLFVLGLGIFGWFVFFLIWLSGKFFPDRY